MGDDCRRYLIATKESWLGLIPARSVTRIPSATAGLTEISSKTSQCEMYKHAADWWLTSG